MKRETWLAMMHPHTRRVYDLIFNQDKPKSKFVVFCKKEPRNSPLGIEMRAWLVKNHRGKWVCIGPRDEAMWSIVGFQDEEVAMRFKLTYGDNE